MTRFRYALAAFCLVQAASVSAQLPELANPSAASGASTSARFFAGASADNGATYSSVHGYADPIDLLTEIQVESAHVNTVGNLYVIIQLDGLYFMGLESGEYVVWDLSGETLQPIRAAKTLQASEPLTLVDDVAFGPAGVSDTSLDVYLAYDTTANPGELYYSGVPLTFSIEAQVQQVQSLTLYQNNISGPIIQAKCISCHVSGGLAG